MSPAIRYVTAATIPWFAPAVAATYPRAYLSAADGQIWVQTSAAAKPFVIAPDSKHKSEPILSPDRTRFAYYGLFWQGDPGRDRSERVVVADFQGKIWLTTEDLLAPNDIDHVSACTQGDGLEWIDNDRLGVTCERGPSVDNYGIISISARRPIRSYLGLDFVWSPDRMQLAHLGLLEHFSPPFEQNECLLIGDRTVSYPGCTWSSPRPDRNKVFRNIHAIGDSSIAWSPDSTHVAYVDRVSDWRMDPHATLDAPEGEFINPRTYLAVAATRHFALGWALGRDCTGTVAWENAVRVAVTCAGRTRSFDTKLDHPLALPW
jgi:hypothetical protein